jgi:hypothetical protein
MHPRNQEIVAPHAEMRNAIARVADPGSDINHHEAVPHQPNQHFGIKIHPLAQPAPLRQCQHRRNRIHPEAAHRIANLQRQGIDPDPDVGQVAAIQSHGGHRFIVLRITDNQR